jgi:hypothetical protein
MGIGLDGISHGAGSDFQAKGMFGFYYFQRFSIGDKSGQLKFASSAGSDR